MSAVTVWYIGFPFGPATVGLVAVANMAGVERRTKGEAMRRTAESSIQGRIYAAAGAGGTAIDCTPLDTCRECGE